MAKVQLSERLYFIVSQDSFDLYYQPIKNKTSRILGYYTSLENLIRKATQFSLHELQKDLSLLEFIRQWKEIQDEMRENVKECKFT